MAAPAEAFFGLSARPDVAAGIADSRPVVVFGRQGTGVLWANAAGTAFFGAASMDDLVARRFSAETPTARELAHLAETLPEGAPQPRRLRFFRGLQPVTATCRCTRITVDGERLVMVAMLDVPALSGSADELSRRFEALSGGLQTEEAFAALPDETPAEHVVETEDEAAVCAESTPLGDPEPEGAQPPENEPEEPAEPVDPMFDIPEGDAPGNAPKPIHRPAPPEEPDAAGAETFAAAGEPAAPPQAGQSVRFVFELDADDRFVFVSPAFAGALGPSAAELAGLSWSDAAARFGIVHAERVTASLARRDTFSGVTVRWPADGVVVPVDLAGMPSFGRDRRFLGWRGFGVCRLGAVESAPAPAEEEMLAPVVDEIGDTAADKPPAEPEQVAVFEDTAEQAPEPEKPASEDQPVESVELPSTEPETATEPEAERAEAGEAEIIALHQEPPVAAGRSPAPRRTADIVQSPIVARPTASRGAAQGGLSKPERDAFRQIAEALGARYQGEPAAEPEPADAPSARRGADTPMEAALLDRLPVPAALLRGSDVLSVNRALLALAGLTDRASFDEAGGIQALFGDSGAPSPGAPTLRRGDGSMLAVEVHLHSVTLASGPASMLVIRGSEAPAEPAPRATDPSLAELETVLDTATDGVLMLDERATVVGANRSAEALFGYERSELIGQPLTRLLAQESHRAALDYVDGLTKNGVASVLNDGREVIGEVRQGGLIPLFMTIGRISATKFCAVLRDITNWKRAEEALVGARRAAETASSQKSDFLAKISHEVRTPLNAIIGFSEVMMEERFGPVGSERYREYLRDIHMSGTHIMSLVDDLLDLSKIEAGKLDLAFEAVSLNDVVNECVALMQPQANRERIIIRTSLASNLPNVVADQRSLRQIVLNLLSNGIKFTPNGGQVIVSTQYEDTGEAVVRVRDTGIGMSREDVERALEPFRQLHTSRGGRGTGLGLPLTKALVEANRANFRIDSAVDHGTLVQVTFPSTRVLAE